MLQVFQEVRKQPITHLCLASVFQIEQQLIHMGYGRNRGELMSKWLIRIEHQDLLPLLNRHNCLRFDPQGLHITEKEWLRDKVFEWLEDHRHVSPPNEARN